MALRLMRHGRRNMQPPPQVTLAIAPGCPHCPGMMEILGQLVKKGDIASLQTVNIAVQQEFATNNEIRSVPWLKIGPFILQGLHTQQEISRWIERCQSETGIQDYFAELLSNGELATVSRAIQASPDIIHQLVPLISSDQTNINVRLGMAAILEELAGQTILENLLDDLVALLKHQQARVRGDAAHFLSFIPSARTIAALKAAANDPDDEVREIVEESLEELEDS